MSDTCHSHRDCAMTRYCDNVRAHAGFDSTEGVCVPRAREVVGGCTEDRQCPLAYDCGAAGLCTVRTEYYSCAGSSRAGLGGSCNQWAEGG
jgi:hypothetical protein